VKAGLPASAEDGVRKEMEKVAGIDFLPLKVSDRVAPAGALHPDAGPSTESAIVPFESEPEPPRICQFTVQELPGIEQEWLATVKAESEVTLAVGPLPSPQKPGNVSVFRPVTVTSISVDVDWLRPPDATVRFPDQRPANAALASWSSLSGGSSPRSTRHSRSLRAR
jgi:hypothetical protein